MNEAAAINFFVAESIGHARSLPMRESLAYLKGLLLVADSHEELDPLRDIYTDLSAVDQQLVAMQFQLALFPEAKS